MKHRLATIILALICCIAPAMAQPLADRVPADAVVYVGWSGSEGLPSSYGQSHLKAVLDQSKFRELFTQLLPQVMDKIAAQNRGARAPMEIVTTLLTQAWTHPTAIYFAGMDMTNPRQPMPKLALICRPGADAAAMAGQINQLLAQAQGSPIRCVQVEDFVVISIGYPDPAKALAGAGASLKQAPAFANAMKQVQADPVSVTYIDFDKALGVINGLLAAEADPQAQVMIPKIIDALGLRGLKRIICTSGFDGRDWMSQTFVEAPTPRTGLLQLLNGKPVSPELLQAIPADATFAVSTRVDIARVITSIRASAAQVDPQAARLVDQALGAVQMAIARNPVTDILEPLGDDWALYCSPSVSGNGILGMVVINRLDDPAKASQSLPIAWTNLGNWVSVMLRQAQAEVTVGTRFTDIDGMRINYIGAPLVAPAWTIRDGYLYMGLYPQPVAAGARWIARGGGKSIGTNEKFAALQKRLGVSNPNGFSYYDLQTTGTQGSTYQQMMMILRYAGFADLFGMTMPEPLLPPLDVLQQHLAPAGSFSWVDDSGYHLKGISPFPGSKLFSEPGMLTNGSPAAGALMASILLPSLNRARETANRVKCAANLKSIGMGLLLYANDHRGQYPPTLGELITTQEVTMSMFICPSGDTSVPLEVAGGPPGGMVKWVNDEGDYVYLGAGKRTNMGAEEILAYEKPGHHGNDGIMILFGDGHVEFMMMPAALQMIDRQPQPQPQPLNRGR